ncbi:MAG: type III pantothenate kinase [Planctomycetota bacterium]
MKLPPLLAVSVGNRRVRLGRFEDGKLDASQTVDVEDASAFEAAVQSLVEPWALSSDLEPAVLMASVNPAREAAVEKALAKHTGRPVARVERDLPVPVGRQLDSEALPGEDRLLNAAAAFDGLKVACAVVDLGTAVTVDFVDGAGTFHGGVIAPGVGLQLDAMAKRLPHLPTLAFEPPKEPIGHNTVEAMRSGVYHGVRGLISTMVEAFAETSGQFPMVVATGGDAEAVMQDWELVDRLAADLTLLGMQITHRTACAARDEADS